jgi:hypothetical protein
MVIQLLDSVKLANAPELAAIYWRPRPRIKRHNVWSLLRGGDRPTGIAAYRPKISDLVKSFGRRQAYKRAEERICGPQGRSTTIEAYCIRCSFAGQAKYNRRARAWLHRHGILSWRQHVAAPDGRMFRVPWRRVEFEDLLLASAGK